MDGLLNNYDAYNRTNLIPSHTTIDRECGITWEDNKQAFKNKFKIEKEESILINLFSNWILLIYQKGS